MNQLRDLIRILIELEPEIPSQAIAQNKVDNSIYNPLDYLQAAVIEPSYHKLLEVIKECDDDAYDAEFSKFNPERIRRLGSMLGNAINDIRRVVSLAKHDPGRAPGATSTIAVDAKSTAESLERTATQWYENVAPTIALVRTKKMDPDAFFKASENASKQLLHLQRTADQSVVRNEAAILTKENLTFVDSVIKGHEDAATLWFSAFIVCILGTIGLLFFLYQPNASGSLSSWIEPANIVLARFISNAVGKVILASFSISMCVVAGRIYQSHVHNVIIAKQRKAAFLSFYPLLKQIEQEGVTDSASIRTELAKEAAQAIFTHGNTGFLSKGNVEAPLLVPLLAELVKRTKG